MLDGNSHDGLPESTPSPQAEQAGKYTILLVDDEPLVRAVQEQILIRAGFYVMSADHGEEAISIYRRDQQRIDLVILDYTMPGINGVETWHILREINPNIRVVFCSGNCPDEEVHLVLGLGARGFVQKPFLIADFVPVIERALAD
jgi:CheY-like chemotaxis protein